MSLSHLLCYAYIGPVRPDGHPRTYVRTVDGASDEAMLRVIEGNLARLTHDVPSLRMERIPIAMQEHVVGVPSSWLAYFGRCFGLCCDTERLWRRQL